MAATENTEPMRRARRADSERKRRLVLAVTDAQLQVGRHPTIAGIARQAGVGRKFIYDHPDLRAGIELKAAQATGQRPRRLGPGDRSIATGRPGKRPRPEPSPQQADPRTREPA